jgi:hypothetical protein
MDYQKQPIIDGNGESEEHRQLRRVAFFSIVISTAAVIASIVTLPMLYSYVASFQSHLVQETDFCKIRARDMWTEMSILNQQPAAHSRGKRQYGQAPQGPQVPQAGGYGPVVAPEVAPQCCNCQQGNFKILEKCNRIQ